MADIGGGMQSQQSDRVQSIQLLRILAALAVAVVHQLYGFANSIGDGLPLPPSHGQLAQAAVCAFFLVSGYVMVVSSERLFGTANGRSIFWTRRFVRVVPSYWLATAFLVAMLILTARAVDAGELVRSLAFIPYWSENPEPFPVPVLWPGWSLFYELVFYGLFGLAVSRSRAATVAICTGVLALLVVIGLFHEPDNAFLWMITRPILLIFPCGIALALWRGDGNSLPHWLRVLAALLAVVAFLFMPVPEGGADFGFAYLAWAALPAILLCVALVGGPLRLPFFPVIDRLGDASYALYLLHIPMGWLWIWGFQKVVVGQPELFAATLITATIIASIAFYVLLERPLLRVLNRLLGARAPRPKQAP